MPIISGVSLELKTKFIIGIRKCICSSYETLLHLKITKTQYSFLKNDEKQTQIVNSIFTGEQIDDTPSEIITNLSIPRFTYDLIQWLKIPSAWRRPLPLA